MKYLLNVENDSWEKSGLMRLHSPCLRMLSIWSTAVFYALFRETFVFSEALFSKNIIFYIRYMKMGKLIINVKYAMVYISIYFFYDIFWKNSFEILIFSNSCNPEEQYVQNVDIRRPKDAIKMSFRYVIKISSKHVLKMSWDVLFLNMHVVWEEKCVHQNL